MEEALNSYYIAEIIVANSYFFLKKAAWYQVNWQYCILMFIFSSGNQSVSNTAIKVQCDQEHSTMGRRIGIQNTQKVCSFPLFSRKFNACSFIALSYLWSFPLFIQLYSLWPLAQRKVLPTEYWARLYQLTMKTMLLRLASKFNLMTAVP